jgi:hypothetical protein
MPSNKRDGYLQIDHRWSPGVDADLTRRINQKSGKNFPIVTEGMNFEADSWVCCHCGTPALPDPSRVRGYCRKCDGYLCHRPECHNDCVPLKKIIDVAQTKIPIMERIQPGYSKALSIEMLRRTILG